MRDNQKLTINNIDGFGYDENNQNVALPSIISESNDTVIGSQIVEPNIFTTPKITGIIEDFENNLQQGTTPILVLGNNNNPSNGTNSSTSTNTNVNTSTNTPINLDINSKPVEASATTEETKTYVSGGTTANSPIVVDKTKTKQNYIVLGIIGLVGVYVAYKVFFKKQ
jgi:hypothetical protein